MRVAAITFVLLTMLNPTRVRIDGPVLSLSGTLVSVAPTVDGLVIAADSRSTIGGRYCDQTNKLLEVSLPNPTVVSVPGIGIVYSRPPADVTDLCEWIKTGRRVMDIEQFAKNWLESHPRDISSEGMLRLGAASLDRVRQLQRISPDASHAYAGNNLYTIVVGSYDSQTKAARIGAVGVRFNPSTAVPEVTDHAFWNFGVESRGDVINFGLFDYITDHVLREGRASAKVSLAFRPGDRRVRDITSGEAAAALSNLMDAAATTSRIVPPPGGIGIGGPTDILLLGAEGKTRRIRWKTG